MTIYFIAISVLVLFLVGLLAMIFPSVRAHLVSDKCRNLASILGTCIAAVAAFFLLYQIDLGGHYFAVDHRPYIVHLSLDARNQLNLPQDKPNEIFFTFILKNTGKSVARDIQLIMKKACRADQDAQNHSELEYCFAKNRVAIEPRNTLGPLSLYPDEEGRMSTGSKMVEKHLQMLLSSGSRIYINFYLTYEGPAFPKGYRTYASSFVLKLTNKEILMVSRDEGDDNTR